MDQAKTWESQKGEMVARARAKAKQIKTDLPHMTPEEVAETIFELHTHQIELEMQHHELLKTQVELQESRDKYSDLYDFAPVGYVTTDIKGIINEANLTFCKLLGRTRQEILGSRLTDHAEAEDQDCFFQHFQKLRNSSSPGLTSLRLRREGLAPLWVEFDSLFFAKEPDDVFFRTIVMDISDRKAREAEKADLLVQLNHAQKQESLGVLAGGMAHNFNNLLVPILGFAEVVQAQLHPDTEMARQVGLIVDSSLKAKQLVDQILFISQKSSPQVTSVAVQETLREVIALMESSIPPRIALHQDIEEDLPMVSADPGHLHQAILNLVLNALQSIPDQGDVWIELSRIEDYGFVDDQGSRQSGPHVCITIRDSGMGIEASDMDQIFDPFFSTKENQNQCGTGLGLTTTARMVKQHNGHITVESDPGVGTVFRVYLPVQISIPQSVAQSASPAKIGNGELILLVDDEPMVCEAVKSLIKHLGYQTEAHCHPEEALRAFTEDPGKYALAMLDYSMPVLSGVQLARELKRIRQDIPILMATGYSDLVTHDNLETFHCQALMNKPYSLASLRSNLSQLIVG